MFSAIAYQILKKKINKLLKDSYLAGLETGYKTGYTAGQADARNRGAIMGGAKVEGEGAEILKGEGF